MRTNVRIFHKSKPIILSNIFSVKLRENDTAVELAEPYFYYGQALLYLGLNEQQVFGSDIVKG